MLSIRLARTGRNKYPTYRIVAAESARAATGKFVAVLGHYNPHTKELVIKKEEASRYLGNGAQPSNSVIKLLQREKIELPKWVSLAIKAKSPKKAAQARAATVAEAAAAPEPVAEASEAPEEVTEGKEAAVAEEAQNNAAAMADSVTEPAPEDTAAGEDAQAAAVTAAEEAGDAAIAEAQAESTEESPES